MGLSSNGAESPSASWGSCRRKAEPGTDRQKCLPRKRGLEKRCWAEMLIEGCRTSGVGPHAASVPLSFPDVRNPRDSIAHIGKGHSWWQQGNPVCTGDRPSELPDGSRMTWRIAEIKANFPEGMQGEASQTGMGDVPWGRLKSQLEQRLQKMRANQEMQLQQFCLGPAGRGAREAESIAARTGTSLWWSSAITWRWQGGPRGSGGQTQHPSSKPRSGELQSSQPNADTWEGSGKKILNSQLTEILEINKMIK